MITYNIRPESPVDDDGITRVNTIAFGRSDEAQLVSNLRALPDFTPGLSLLAATPQGEIIGHILFSLIHIVEGERSIPSLALAPMCVHPDYQNQGIGSALVRNGLNQCQLLDYEHVIVLGHPEFYPRFGFLPASKWNICAPFPVADAAFMAYEIRPHALDGVQGVVRYPQAFEGV